MASAAVAAYASAHPQDSLALLGIPLTLSVFEHTPFPCTRIPYDRKGVNAGIGGMVRLSRELRSFQFETAYLLTNSFSSALIPWLAGIPRRVGTVGHWKQALLTDSVVFPEAYTHQAQRYAFLLNGAFPESLRPVIFLSEAERQTYGEKLCALAESRPCIALAAGAAYGSAKRWLPERFAALARHCAQEWDARVLLLGSAQEAPLLEWIQEQAGEGTLSLAGKTTLREMYGYLHHCRAVVANDSGLMHCAAALGTPVIGLFGPTNSRDTGPLGESVRIIHHDLPCAPCFQRECPLGHQDCMKKINVDEVFQTLAEMLEAGH